MLLKLLLAALFILSLSGAFVLAPLGDASPDDHLSHASEQGDTETGRRLRLLSWNIGNGDLEAETRAHAEDLPAVAQVILDNDPDAVALQELADAEQLKLLLTHLSNRYRGYVSSAGSSDRVEAVLVKKHGERNVSGARGRPGQDGARFSDIPAGDRFAAAATFSWQPDAPEIVLVSAHADAFSASRRRTFAADIVDWELAPQVWKKLNTEGVGSFGVKFNSDS